ncbi:MAG: DUF3108 domain-containing protein [Hyphomicrobiales bacterium]|nr:DUF3108 domain-containing protein [Hyphomicrobiales bacterium]
MSQPLVRCAVLAVLATGAATCIGEGAQAQGSLDARYEVTLGGMAFGRGSWHINVGEDQFTSTISGATSGLMRLFSTGRGTSASRGSANGGTLNASSYSSSISTTSKYDEVRMQLNAGTVKDYIAEPPNNPDPQRVPLQESHRRGVLDPMTAAILRVPGSGDTFVPQACNRKLAIFDGRMRYDLQLAFRRLDRVKSPKGYQGTAVVCNITFRPVAGHIPTRPTIRYLAELRDTEIWLAPIAGTRLMVPYRASLPTPLGLGVLEATQFITMAQSSPRATPASARPQP